MATAKHRAVDQVRRRVVLERKREQIASELEREQRLAVDHSEPELGEEIEDDLLRLVFMTCHPVLSKESRVALTLRVLGGLRTDEIARAFLAAESTIAQRIVRAKRTLTEAQVPFELPAVDELGERVAAVLEVTYLIFNEGYAATSGEDWMRPALCEDALRIGRMLQALMPGEPEVHGLAALMEIQASRIGARTSPTGEPVLLEDQDRLRWDRVLITRGLSALQRAQGLGGALGSYSLQAAIAACHARAASVEDTDWVAIAALYDALAQISGGSPVVELNRAVAVAMAFGPEAGLELVDALSSDARLAGYHLLPAVRGDLLARLGRTREATEELARAASVARNDRERTMLLERAAALSRER